MEKQISYKIVGIIGAGNIGQAFGRREKAYDINILYWSRSRKPCFEEEIGVVYVSLEKLLQSSDFISLHLPSNRDTYHLINR